MSAGAVIEVMAKDRTELLLCGDRHAGIVEFYRRRDAGLAGLK
jgi:hypothetical protein